MSAGKPNIKSGRLSTDVLADNFADMHPPLSRSEALIEADRCYFCHDAPCITACPTGIDIPKFIQQIRSDNLKGSARTILTANIMGGMCARVCPTEILCEEVCVRNTHEDKPVTIGLLQRHATDPIFANDIPLFERAADSGKRVAVVGAGPAGLACAHRLAMLGHAVVVFNRDAKVGGLNEYGIAAYKTVDDFAQREAAYVLGIGNIDVRNGQALGRDFSLTQLRAEYDAVFLGLGLGGVNSLGIPGEELPGVEDAVAYIANLRQAADKSTLPVGQRVLVIGGGMTAIDIAVQSKRLGAEQVNLVYRRGPEQMGASAYEQAFAQTSGVQIHHWAAPVEIHGCGAAGDDGAAGTGGDGGVSAVEFARTRLSDNGQLELSSERWQLEADVVFKAVGQNLALPDLGEKLKLERGKLAVDELGRCSLPDVWAGGDCALGGDDLTVTAVQQGKVAAIAMDKWLRGDKADG